MDGESWSRSATGGIGRVDRAFFEVDLCPGTAETEEGTETGGRGEEKIVAVE